MPKFQNKLWNESRVMTETVQKPYNFNEIRDANLLIVINAICSNMIWVKKDFQILLCLEQSATGKIP